MKNLKIVLGIIACLIALFPPVGYKPGFRSSGNDVVDFLGLYAAEQIKARGGPPPSWETTQTRLAFIFAIGENESIAFPWLIGELAVLGLVGLAISHFRNLPKTAEPVDAIICPPQAEPPSANSPKGLLPGPKS